MSGLLRDVLIVKAAPAGAGELISGNFEREVLDRLAARMTKEELLYCMDAVATSAMRKASRRSAPGCPAWKSPSGQAPPFRPLRCRQRHPRQGRPMLHSPKGERPKAG